MKKTLTAAVLVAAALLLSACSGGVSSGTITGKVIEPERRYVCSVKPVMYCTDDEDWRFDLTNDERNGWVYVDPETFDQYEVGDWYEVSK